MGILNFYPGIGNLGLLGVFLCPFVIQNHDTFSFLELVGKLCLTISMKIGSPNTWCVFPLSSFVFLSYRDCSSNDFFLLIFFVALDCPDLEDRHHHWVCAALAYAHERILMTLLILVICFTVSWALSL